MAAYVGVISRDWINAGRLLNKTYKNVLTRVQSLGDNVNSLAEFLASKPSTHPWNDAGSSEFAVELDGKTEYDSLSSTVNLFHQGRQNLPKWQQQGNVSGVTKDFGSFADPEDDQSTFTSGVMLIDYRFILRVYDDDPVANGSAVHIGSEEFDETVDTLITRYMRIFNAAGTPLNLNAANQRTEVGGKLMDFDFGSSHTPAVSAGVTTFQVDISRSGKVQFQSNHSYRFIGPEPAGLSYYEAAIFGKILKAPAEG